MPLKAFSVNHNRGNRKKGEEKNTLSVQIEPLASLTAHLLCFWENGSLPFDNKNHGEKNIIFFRQCCLPLLAATWTASQKAGNSHFLVAVLYELYFYSYINILIFFSLSSRGGGDGRTERLRQSNDLIASKKKTKAKAVILLHDIYPVVRCNCTQTQGYN